MMSVSSLARMIRVRKIIAFGDAYCFSFYATKAYNSIDGGAVSFKDKWLYDTLYDL